MFLKKVVEKIKTHFLFNNCFPTIAPFMIMSENVMAPEEPQMSQYGAYALHA
jgi:hypothetical protein